MDKEEGAMGSPRIMSKKLDGSSGRLYFATFCACLGALSFGYVIGYSSPAIPALEKEQILTKEQSAWFAALMTIGAIIGGPFAGWCIEKLGRKSTMTYGAVPFMVGWFCIYTATSSSSLYFGRFMCGFASGMVTVSVPVYIAEISTNSLRGTLGSCTQLFITVGILAAYAAGMKYSWQTMALIGIMPSFLVVFAAWFIPETPRWLLMQGQKNDAVQSLRLIRHAHADCEDECRDIEEGLDVKEAFSWSEFKKQELSRPLLISVIIMIFQQLSGINAVMFYTVSIFKSAGLQNSELATVLVGFVQVVATLVACYLMDKLGRRKMLITAGTMMSLSCFIFGFYYYTSSGTSQSTGNSALPVVSLVVYIIGFSLGWGPIPMLIMSEIFPSRIRGAASGVAVMTNWLTSFIVVKEFPVVQDMIGPAGTFWLFAFSCMSSVIFVWKKVPETKGKSLEDIELFFLGKSMMNV